MPSSAATPTTEAFVIRRAYPDDAAALARLAILDSRRPPEGAVLVAERDGRILAALSLADGRAIADPFEPTADLVDLLRVHARASARGRAATAGHRTGVSARRCLAPATPPAPPLRNPIGGCGRRSAPST